MTELIVIMVVALIVIGPQRLPDLAKSLGRALRDFKRATSDFQESLNLDDDYDSKEFENSISASVEEEKEPGPENAEESTKTREEEPSTPSETAETRKSESGPDGTTNFPASSASPDEPREGPERDKAETK